MDEFHVDAAFYVCLPYVNCFCWTSPKNLLMALIGGIEKRRIWDFNWLNTPYVHCHIFIRKFGDRWIEVVDKYFDEFEHLYYQFKEQYNIERKIVVVTMLEDDAYESIVQEVEVDQAQCFETLHVNFNL